MIMKKRQIGTAVLLASLTANGFLMTGCTNSDYDFNNVDKTMGFGGDLTLPTSSTMNIPLKDILKLKEDGCVSISPFDSTYYFYKDGEKETSANPSIGCIELLNNGRSFTTSSFYVGPFGTGTALSGQNGIYKFNYSGLKPSEIEELQYAGTKGTMTITTDLSQLYQKASVINEVKLTFPEYMAIESTQGTVEGNVLTITNQPIASHLEIEVNIVGLDFTKTGSGLTISGNNFTMGGYVDMTVNATAKTATTSSMEITVSTDVEMGQLTVQTATGKFNPTIDLGDLGKVNITGIPDFLSGENVKVDLDNPQIVLLINNDMPMKAKLDGTLTSSNSSVDPVSFNGVKINAKDEDYDGKDEDYDGKTCAVICRKKIQATDGEDKYIDQYEVPTLSTIIEELPDYIKLDVTAEADNKNVYTVTLEKEYTVTALYSMWAPLAFAENAVIEYSDSFSGWHKDLEDIALAEGTYISLTAMAQNKLPLALNIAVTPVDVDGKDISSLIDINIKQGKVPASADGKTAAEGTLEIEIREKTSGALKKLDGLSYTFLASAKQDGKTVTGITLNAKDHTLKLNDIKVKIVGQVIADLN